MPNDTKNNLVQNENRKIQDICFFTKNIWNPILNWSSFS